MPCQTESENADTVKTSRNAGGTLGIAPAASIAALV
jgi:hypothetical protein